MNANEFWNMLSENSKKKVEKILNGYAGSEGIIGRIFEMYEEGAVLSDCTIEECSLHWQADSSLYHQ